MMPQFGIWTEALDAIIGDSEIIEITVRHSLDRGATTPELTTMLCNSHNELLGIVKAIQQDLAALLNGGHA